MVTLRPLGICCLLLQVDKKFRWASALVNATAVCLYSFLSVKSLSAELGSGGSVWLVSLWLGVSKRATSSSSSSSSSIMKSSSKRFLRARGAPIRPRWPTPGLNPPLTTIPPAFHYTLYRMYESCMPSPRFRRVDAPLMAVMVILIWQPAAKEQNPNYIGKKYIILKNYSHIQTW